MSTVKMISENKHAETPCFFNKHDNILATKFVIKLANEFLTACGVCRPLSMPLRYGHVDEFNFHRILPGEWL